MTPYYEQDNITLFHGDCREVLRQLPDESVDCCVTSPPYFGLRDYGVEGQIGLEQTPDTYVAELVAVFREVRRVLKDDGVCWINLGDSYASQGGERKYGSSDGGTGRGPATDRIGCAGLKPKDLIGIPWQVAFALRADGWYLRQDIIWAKPNPMPESVTDRCTKAHEYIFLLSKNERYWYDAEAIKEPQKESSIKRAAYRLGGFAKADDAGEHVSYVNNPNTVEATRLRALNGEGANKRSVWTVPTHSFPSAHFATFPPKLIEPCIKAGCRAGGTVLDPFNGAGTTGLVAMNLNCKYIGIELNRDYLDMSASRLSQGVLAFEGGASTSIA